MDIYIYPDDRVMIEINAHQFHDPLSFSLGTITNTHIARIMIISLYTLQRIEIEDFHFD
jgi:hypothetical protein